MPQAVHSSTDRDTSICSFMRLASHVARGYHHWSLGADDLAQIAVLAMISAVDMYDPGNGVTLAQYIACKCRQACYGAVRRARNEDDRRGAADVRWLPDSDSGWRPVRRARKHVSQTESKW